MRALVAVFRDQYKERIYGQPLETRRLLQAARGEGLEALYVVAIATGLRQGELLALKWKDLDLGRGMLRVRRTITRTGGKFL